MKSGDHSSSQFSNWLKIFHTLNEAQKRWLAAEKALELGWGGISRIQKLTRLSRPTILKGIEELRNEKELGLSGRVRKCGAGRKHLVEVDDSLLDSLQKILDETTGGDPMSSLKWTAKSAQEIATELQNRGHPISVRTVDSLLNQMDYSLQANRKNIEGKSHPERNRQFKYIQKRIKNYISAGDPVISVDTKKKSVLETSKIQAKYG